MIDLQAYLEQKTRNIISAWEEDDIYAISFFVYANESFEYKGYTNVTEFYVGYNTERDCDGADKLSEERWNYAFWNQDATPIIEAYDENEGMKILFDWYAETGIENIGNEDYSAAYDENMRYIGKGPVGYYEFLSEITAVAKKCKKAVLLRTSSEPRFLLSSMIWSIRGMLSKRPRKRIRTEKRTSFLRP